MNSNFKRYIANLEEVHHMMNSHLMYLIHDFELINPNKIDGIHFIKNCGN